MIDYYVIKEHLSIKQLMIIEEIMKYTNDKIFLDKLAEGRLSVHDLQVVLNYVVFNIIDEDIIYLNKRYDFKIKFIPNKTDYVAKGLLAGINTDIYDRPGFSLMHRACLYTLLIHKKEEEAKLMARPYLFSIYEIEKYTTLILNGKMDIKRLVLLLYPFHECDEVLASITYKKQEDKEKDFTITI